MSSQTLFIKDYMTKKVITVAPDMNIMEAISILIKNDISGAPVIDASGKLVGILTERDCLDVVIQVGYFEDFAGPVSKFMTTEVKVTHPDDDLLDIAQTFVQSTFRRFPVLDNEKLVGLISRRDLVRAICDRTNRVYG
jgi:CBS domain-containing protein